MPRAKDKGKAHKRKRPSKALIGRVKRAVKKSRRKMDEERFHKELQRTIKFLEGINVKIASPKKSGKDTSKKTAGKAAEIKPATGAKPAAAPANPATAPAASRRVQAKKKK